MAAENARLRERVRELENDRERLQRLADIEHVRFGKLEDAEARIAELEAALGMMAAVVGDANEDAGHCVLCRRSLGQPHSKPCPVEAARAAMKGRG